MSLTQSPLFELRQVSKHYPRQSKPLTILNEISLTIPQHTFLSIVGPSGSGKSTLLHLLGLLDTCSSGEILYQQAPIHDCSESWKDRFRQEIVGFIFQAFYLLPYLNVLQNVLLPFQYQRASKKKKNLWKEREDAAHAILGKVGLAHRLHHLPTQLSGGECQRVAIARALVKNPEIILADEPTGNLDQTTGFDVLELLQTFHQQGKTILLVTHDLKAASFTEQTFHLDKGELTR